MNIEFKDGDFVIYRDRYLCQVVDSNKIIEELFYIQIIEYVSECINPVSIGNKISICTCSDCSDSLRDCVKLITNKKEINRLNKMVIFQ